jgi:hypothetical protein
VINERKMRAFGVILCFRKIKKKMREKFEFLYEFLTPLALAAQLQSFEAYI